MTTQADPPSEAQQLADARTALAVHIARIAELEAIVSRQRAEINTAHAIIRTLDRQADHLRGQCVELTGALAVFEETSTGNIHSLD